MKVLVLVMLALGVVSANSLTRNVNTKLMKELRNLLSKMEDHGEKRSNPDAWKARYAKIFEFTTVFDGHHLAYMEVDTKLPIQTVAQLQTQLSDTEFFAFIQSFKETKFPADAQAMGNIQANMLAADSDPAAFSQFLKDNTLADIEEVAGEVEHESDAQLIRMLIRGSIAGTAEADSRSEKPCPLDPSGVPNIVCVLNKAYSTMEAVDINTSAMRSLFFDRMHLPGCTQVWDYMENIEAQGITVDGGIMQQKIDSVMECVDSNNKKIVAAFETHVLANPEGPKNVMPLLLRFYGAGDVMKELVGKMCRQIWDAAEKMAPARK